MIAAGVMNIDRLFLEEQGACKGQIELFAATFPVGADLSRANLLVAARTDLNLDWLAATCLPFEDWRCYSKAMGPAWRAYFEAGCTAAALHAYRQAKATALADALGLD